MIAHAVPVGVPLVSVVDVGTVVSLIEDVCRIQGENRSKRSLEKARCFSYLSKQRAAKLLVNKK